MEREMRMTMDGLRASLLASALGTVGLSVDAAVATGEKIGNSTGSVVLGILCVIFVVAIVYQYRERATAQSEQLRAIRAAYEKELESKLEIARLTGDATAVIRSCKAAQVQADKEARKHGG